MYVFFANGFSNIMDTKLFTISIGYNACMCSEVCVAQSLVCLCRVLLIPVCPFSFGHGVVS